MTEIPEHILSPHISQNQFTHEKAQYQTTENTPPPPLEKRQLFK